MIFHLHQHHEQQSLLQVWAQFMQCAYLWAQSPGAESSCCMQSVDNGTSWLSKLSTGLQKECGVKLLSLGHRVWEAVPDEPLLHDTFPPACQWSAYPPVWFLLMFIRAALGGFDDASSRGDVVAFGFNCWLHLTQLWDQHDHGGKVIG